MYKYTHKIFCASVYYLNVKTVVHFSIIYLESRLDKGGEIYPSSLWSSDKKKSWLNFI